MLFLGLAATALATTRYVDVKCAHPAWPYTTWAAASTNIQVAIDAAGTGDEIVVTNGVYAVGGKAMYLTMTNRVAVNKRVSVRSVNGPDSTVIQGHQLSGTTNGDGAIRCVYLSAGASLSGFTLTGGATRIAGDYANERSGGGLWCDTSNPSVSNCVVVGNAATGNGGGAFYGTFYNCTFAQNWTIGSGGAASGAVLNNCTISSNAAVRGGGVHSSTGPGQGFAAVLNNCTLVGNVASDSGGGVNASTANNCALSGNRAGNQGGGALASALLNCTLVGNSASYGGGASGGNLTNCIVYFNAATVAGSNYYGSSLAYSCAAPLPSGGYGNSSFDPQLASAAQISTNSPCRGAGQPASATGTDIDGEPWGSPPAIGCDEPWAGAVTGMLSVAVSTAYATTAVGFRVDVVAWISGRASASVWNFGDGTTLTNQPWTSHAWAAPGDYPVVAWAYNDSWPGGVSATAMVHVVTAPTHYVALDSPGPKAPYDSWATAATNIQDAVDAATVPSALVLVTNGTYAAGGAAVFGTMTNRVAVAKPLVVRSVNGPEVTLIRGCQLPGATNGDGAVRCVYLTNGAFLSGFTLTNGATRSAGDPDRELNAGGFWGESPSAVVSNCIIAGNASARHGAGAYMGTLINCTLTGNSAATNGGGACNGTLIHCTLGGNRALYGAGASGGTLSNCTLSANSAKYHGGGAYNASLNNAFLAENAAVAWGGGAYGGTLNNCTLTGNSARQAGGGTYSSVLYNCIVCFNQAPFSENAAGTNLNYCCTTPLPCGGVGNISSDPQLAGGPHLSSGSPCWGMGNAAYAAGADIDGEPWASPPSIGCDEFSAATPTGPLSAVIDAPFTNVAVGWPLAFTAEITGWASASVWDFGDGTVVSNEPYASHAWAAAGDYNLVLRAYNASYPGGITTSLWVHVVPQPVHYVAAGSATPLSPYDDWTNAAPDIQSAVDVAVPGALILVTNGTYAAGGRAVDGSMTNRVVVSKPLLVRSVNGPDFTTIQGKQSLGYPVGDSSIRCVYLASGAYLSGFTVTNGTTRGAAGLAAETSGGGIWCESPSCVVSNCTITGNVAYTCGCGAFGGTLNNCALTSNRAQLPSSVYGGGAWGSTLNNCTLANNFSAWDGGGAWGSTLNNCSLKANMANYNGGGAFGGALNHCALEDNLADLGGGACSNTLNNCTLVGNSAWNGGGAWYSILNNCTLTGNSVSYGGGGASVSTLKNCTLAWNSPNGAYYGALYNCIVYYNASSGVESDYNGSTLIHCCTTPLPTGGFGNITNAPLFVDAVTYNMRLRSTSPCINAGNNAYAPPGPDLDGNPRIASGSVDIGAFEFQGIGSLISYAWLQQYGLPTDGSADYLDSDHDGLNNWQEWCSRTDPTNALSALRLVALTGDVSGVTLSWQSVTNRVYWLERMGNLESPSSFSTVASHIPGLSGTTTYTDTNAASAEAFFYRVGVQP